jgi:serine phosphatase RsbU (regulator of sigma subunit)/ligand-binding sensor domain-containing protein
MYPKKLHILLSKLTTFLGVALLLLSFCAYSQELGKPFVQSYMPKQYQAATQNWDIVQDELGIMYFANNEGVLQFNGVDWSVTPVSNKSTVRSLDLDNNGIVYAGGINEFGYLRPNETGKLEYVSISANVAEEDKKFGDIWRTIATREGIYFQSNTHLFRWAKGKIKVWKPKKRRFQMIAYVHDRFFVKEQEMPLMEMVRDEVVKFRTGDLYEKDGILNLLPYEGDKMLAYSPKTSFQIISLNPKSEVVITKLPTEVDSALVKYSIYTMFKQPDGTYVLPTRRGGSFIIDKNGKLLRKLQRAEGLHTESHYATWTDKQNGLWIGTNNGIIYVEVNAPLTIFNDRQGLEGTVYCITRIDGVLYAGTSLGVFYLDKSANVFRQIEGLSAQVWEIEKVVIGGETKILLASAGLFELKNNKAIPLVQSSIFTVYPSPSNPLRVYFGGKEFIAALIYKSGKWEEEGRLKLKGDDIRSIIEDKSGTLWASVNLNGVRKVTLNGNKLDSTATLTKYDTAQGLPLKENKFFNIGGEMLVATEKGVKRYSNEGNNFVPYSKFGTQFGDGTYTVSNLLEDNKRNVWLFANKGKQYLLGVSEYQNDGTYKWNPTPYYRIPTMTEVNFWADDNEVTWFGGSEGLFRFDSKIMKNYFMPSQTLISKVFLHNDSILFHGYEGKKKSNLVLPKQIYYQNNTVNFEYALPNFENHQQNEYSYYLQGFDESWSTWTKETKKEYTNLPAGKYKFRVKSKNIYGTEGKEASYQFKILPPWYQTWWAYLGYVLLAILTIYTTVRLYTRNLQARNAALEQTIAERTAQIEAKKQEIENSYENIQVLSEIGKQITASLDLDKVLNTLYENVNQLMDATVFGIGLYEEAKQQIHYRLAIENGVRYTPFSRTMADKNQFPVWCIEQKDDVMIADVFAEYQRYISNYQDEEQKASLEDGSLTNTVYAMLYTPVFAHDKVIGVITVQSYQKNAYTVYHLNILKSLAIYASIALKNADTFHEIELQKQEILASINYAQRIQNAMLPTTQDLDKLLGVANYFAIYKPRDIVSGDFYWCKEIGGKIIFSVADCTGHGVPGAFVSMVGNAALNEITKRGLSHTHLILNKLDKEITNFFNQNTQIISVENSQTKDNLQVQDGMDICLIAIDKEQKKISYSGAMNPLYLVQEGKILELKADKKAIGGNKIMQNTVDFASKEINLTTSTTIYLCSDGYQDQFGGVANKKFMTKKLRELLLSISHLSMTEQRQILDKTIVDWIGTGEQTDDITVVGLVLKP